MVCLPCNVANFVVAKNHVLFHKKCPGCWMGMWPGTHTVLWDRFVYQIFCCVGSRENVRSIFCHKELFCNIIGFSIANIKSVCCFWQALTWELSSWAKYCGHNIVYWRSRTKRLLGLVVVWWDHPQYWIQNCQCHKCGDLHCQCHWWRSQKSSNCRSRFDWRCDPECLAIIQSFRWNGYHPQFVHIIWVRCSLAWVSVNLVHFTIFYDHVLCESTEICLQLLVCCIHKAKQKVIICIPQSLSPFLYQ